MARRRELRWTGGRTRASSPPTFRGAPREMHTDQKVFDNPSRRRGRHDDSGVCRGDAGGVRVRRRPARRRPVRHGEVGALIRHRRRAGVGRLADEQGMATAELAVAIPTLVLVLFVALSALATVTDQVRCVDAARATARALARGDDPGAAVSAGKRLAPPGAAFSVTGAGASAGSGTGRRPRSRSWCAADQRRGWAGSAPGRRRPAPPWRLGRTWARMACRAEASRPDGVDSLDVADSVDGAESEGVAGGPGGVGSLGRVGRIRLSLTWARRQARVRSGPRPCSPSQRSAWCSWSSWPDSPWEAPSSRPTEPGPQPTSVRWRLPKPCSTAPGRWRPAHQGPRSRVATEPRPRDARSRLTGR